MKVIINTINIYNIHDNKFIIRDNNFNTSSEKIVDADLSDIVPHIVVNDNDDHPLIAQLEARILQSEREKKELLDKPNNENK